MNDAVVVLVFVIFALVGNTTAAMATNETLNAIMGVDCGDMTASECFLYLESLLPECPKNYYGNGTGLYDLLDRGWCR